MKQEAKELPTINWGKRIELPLYEFIADRCPVSQGHKFKKYMGILYVMTKECVIRKICIPLRYCEECKQYHINTLDVLWAKFNYGMLLCKIDRRYIENMISQSFPQDYRSKYQNRKRISDIKHIGYRVDKDSDLTASHRQAFLQALIDFNVYSKDEIVQFLKDNLQQHRNHDNMAEAWDKWYNDLRVVNHYDSNALKLYTIDNDTVIPYRDKK